MRDDLPPVGSPERKKMFEESLDKMRKVQPVLLSYRTSHRGKGEHIIECPACGGRLHFSIAGSNGHALVRCESKDCVSWIE